MPTRGNETSAHGLEQTAVKEAVGTGAVGAPPAERGADLRNGYHAPSALNGRTSTLSHGLDTVVAVPRTQGPQAWAAVKRGLDVMTAAVLLVVLSPLMALIALLIRTTSPGPVIFRQVRCGARAQPFTVYKFRTMWAWASPEAHEAFIEKLAGNTRASGGLHKLTTDSRVTPVGRFLRRASLDELPQLVNVLLGSMSLIGPRPVPLYELQYYRPQDFERFRVRPGITGLWQVSGRSRLGFYEMLELDAEYARQSSLALDLWIALRTPVAMITSRTA